MPGVLLTAVHQGVFTPNFKVVRTRYFSDFRTYRLGCRISPRVVTGLYIGVDFLDEIKSDSPKIQTSASALQAHSQLTATHHLPKIGFTRDFIASNGFENNADHKPV